MTFIILKLKKFRLITLDLKLKRNRVFEYSRNRKHFHYNLSIKIVYILDAISSVCILLNSKNLFKKISVKFLNFVLKTTEFLDLL